MQMEGALQGAAGRRVFGGRYDGRELSREGIEERSEMLQKEFTREKNWRDAGKLKEEMAKGVWYLRRAA